MKQPAVYILANDRNGTLYTGVTSDLIGRTWQHKEHVVEGFTRSTTSPNLSGELRGMMDSAIVREKRIEAWKRTWKIRLIEEMNPYWNDLWFEVTAQPDKVKGQDAGSLPSQG